MKNNQIGYCKHCDKPIAFYHYLDFWFHVTPSGGVKLCADGNHLAEPKVTEKALINDMPSTDEGWYLALGRQIKVSAIDVWGSNIIIEGVISEINLGKHLFDVCNDRGCHWVKMEGMVAFEFIKESA